LPSATCQPPTEINSRKAKKKRRDRKRKWRRRSDVKETDPEGNFSIKVGNGKINPNRKQLI